jgi:hypothetical protein
VSSDRSVNWVNKLCNRGICGTSYRSNILCYTSISGCFICDKYFGVQILLLIYVTVCALYRMFNMTTAMYVSELLFRGRIKHFCNKKSTVYLFSSLPHCPQNPIRHNGVASRVNLMHSHYWAGLHCAWTRWGWSSNATGWASIRKFGHWGYVTELFCIWNTYRADQYLLSLIRLWSKAEGSNCWTWSIIRSQNQGHFCKYNLPHYKLSKLLLKIRILQNIC